MRSSTSPVAKLLADLKKALGELEVRWFLFGAQAAVLHGAARLTADVDVTVDAGKLSTEELVRAASRHGFSPQIPDPEFVRLTRVVPLVHQATRLPVDLVLAGPGLEDLFLERATRVQLGRLRVPVIALEDLIVTKVISGRPKDLDDVDALLTARGHDVDVEQIRETLRLAEALLDQSDLVRALDARLSRAPAERRARARRVKRKAPRTV